MVNVGFIGWRVLLSAVFTIVLSIFISGSMPFFITVWGIVTLLSIILLKNAVLKSIVDFIMSDEFDVRFSFLYKCMIIILGLTMFSSITVAVVVYKSVPETPVSTITGGFFAFYIGLTYLIKYFRKNPLPFCGGK